MTLRNIDIAKLTLQILRPNYAITNGYTDETGAYHAPRLNKIYRFILCLIYPLKSHIDTWDYARGKAYAIAVCQYGRKQVIAILNRYYSDYGPISLMTIDTASLYLYHPADTIPLKYYCWKSKTSDSYIYTKLSSWEGNAEYYSTTGGEATSDKNQLSEAGTISIEEIQTSYTLQSDKEITDLLYLYAENESGIKPVYMGLEGAFATNPDVIFIPQALKDSDKYNDFVADLNAMLLYGVKITIKTI